MEFVLLLEAALVKIHSLEKVSCARTLPTAAQLLTNYLACDNQEVPLPLLGREMGMQCSSRTVLLHRSSSSSPLIARWCERAHER